MAKIVIFDRSLSSINLHFLSAYWCYQVSGNHKERFYWASEAIDELAEEVSDTTMQTLILLAMTAPDELSEAIFAAGPLEDYINLIVERQLANEAAFIVGNMYLRHCLSNVWGKREELKELAKRGNPARAYVPLPNPDANLKALTTKTLMGFWCHTYASSKSSEYQTYYDEVLTKLANKKSRPDVINDLLCTTPDESAVQYLKENSIINKSLK